MARYIPGDSVTVSASFKNGAEVAADPDIVTFIVRDSTGAETSYVNGVDAEVIRTATGEYSSTVVLENPRSRRVRYAFRWQGVGSINAAEETFLTVHPSWDN